MDIRMATGVAFLVLVAGCSTREEELQKQLDRSEQDRQAITQTVVERDRYLEDVIQSVNEVYADLEEARVKEGKLVTKPEGPEGPVTATSLDTRQKLLADIGEIGTVLKENRKRIANLEARSRQSHQKIAGLDKLIENLKTSLAEREQSIAQLEGKVQGLEATVAENTQAIATKDGIIDDQKRTMNTAYYVIGTRDELRKKGIIKEEGGFLWGLVGETTVLESGVDLSNFTKIDVTRDQVIHITGEIDEIVPQRRESFFAMAKQEPDQMDLTIVDPNSFWQDKYLVIVVN